MPAIAELVARGTLGTGVTTFPSVTPVCLTTIATGAHPDVHGVPHLAWYHRGEGRIVEYGSSFPAMRAVGARQAFRDAIFTMSHEHVSRGATTVFEAVEDAGLVPAAINFTSYRGRTRHPIRLPALAARNRWYEAVYGPQRFFFFNLFESDDTGAGLAVRSRHEGSNDAYAGAIGRWLVTRDGFDFLVFYLPDFDYASHLVGPTSPVDALARADAAVGQLQDAAGGPDELLDRYGIVLCSDHGQTHVEQVARLQEPFADLELLARAARRPVARRRRSSQGRTAPGWSTGCPAARSTCAGLPSGWTSWEPADVVLFREGDEAVARREREELRFRPEGDGWQTNGDPDVLDEERYPDGLSRAWHALACPNAGEVLVSVREGWELADLGGRSHAGGGSHGSLLAGDSRVPVLTAGLARASMPDDPSLTELAPLVLAELGVDPPASMRPARVSVSA